MGAIKSVGNKAVKAANKQNASKSEKAAKPDKSAKPDKPAKPEKERNIPGVISPTKLNDYLEIMTIAVFQAGVSWAIIQNKWKNFQAAFADFDPKIVSKFSQNDIDRLMQDQGIMRSEKKIKGTIENAKLMLEMEAKHGTFQNYLRSFKSYEQLSADIHKRFKYIGEMSVYYFVFRVGEKVPPFEPWIVTIEGEHPRMREMVEKHLANQPTEE